MLETCAWKKGIQKKQMYTLYSNVYIMSPKNGHEMIGIFMDFLLIDDDWLMMIDQWIYAIFWLIDDDLSIDRDFHGFSAINQWLC